MVNRDFPTAGNLLGGQGLRRRRPQGGRRPKALAEFLRVIQPSRSEFQELAAVYERLGEADKAAEMRARRRRARPFENRVIILDLRLGNWQD